MWVCSSISAKGCVVWCLINAGTPTFVIAVGKHRNFNSTPCILRRFVHFNHALLYLCQWHYGLAFSGRGSLPEVKRQMREVDHSCASSEEVKNRWSCTSAPLIRLNHVDRNRFSFNREWAMNRSLPAVCSYVFIIFAATVYIWRPSPPPANLRTHSAVITQPCIIWKNV
jgi:hypothetical protein